MSRPNFHRYAIFHVPTGALGDFGAAWLGWDCRTGKPRAGPPSQPWTHSAQRYGFHATLKAPFRLAEARSPSQLDAAARAFAQRSAPVCLGPLKQTWLGRFLALVPSLPCQGVSDLAARCVTDFDDFRAPQKPQDIAKYAGRSLSADLRDNLTRWGYPYIFNAFRFHMTLTDRVPKSDRPKIEAALCAPEFLSRPYVVDHISLVGEDIGGMFHEITTYPLAAAPDGSAR
ncbi:DUF1045 domain-containing protein [Marivita sp. S0852]|uniref:DUF1045 domain-containing protein n=1 Tax=Marivita sp. S0852 TaxID=3373893 RepID=UPI003982AD68